jgi:hypothetical protein
LNLMIVSGNLVIFLFLPFRPALVRSVETNRGPGPVMMELGQCNKLIKPRPQSANMTIMDATTRVNEHAESGKSAHVPVGRRATDHR